MIEQDRAEFLKDFGNRVKTLRLAHNMTLEELARKIGYTTDNARSSVQKIEAGKSDPPASRIRALADALETTCGVLMGWEEMDQAINTAKLSREAAVFDQIKEVFGDAAQDAISSFVQLDAQDQAEIRGEMRGMLKADKYGE